MSHEFVTFLIYVIGGGAALVAVTAFVIVPVARIYPTWWERTAGVVLALVILVGFAGLGAYLGLGFVDRFLSD
ncbi:MAG: hypothetical protein M0P31_09935 [Solirubrobacteraceae bacterium]|nr:hypothetical protein [Solirubrobacteraceae bacterium]